MDSVWLKRGLLALAIVLAAGCVAALLLPLGEVVSLLGLILIGLGCAPIYPCVIHSTPANIVRKYAPSLKFQMSGDAHSTDFDGVLIDNYSQGLRFDFVSREFLKEVRTRRERGLITTY